MQQGRYKRKEKKSKHKRTRRQKYCASPKKKMKLDDTIWLDDILMVKEKVKTVKQNVS